MIHKDDDKAIKKRRFLTIRITSQEKAFLENQATERGIDVSEYTREILFGGENAAKVLTTVPRVYGEEFFGESNVSE